MSNKPIIRWDGERFYQAIQTRGYTMQEFAKVMDEIKKENNGGKSTITQQMVQNWKGYEYRSVTPSITYGAYMAKGLGMSMDFLCHLTDVPNPTSNSDLTEDEQELIALARQKGTTKHLKQLLLMLTQD